MNSRQEADYGLKFSETDALDLVENAEKFLKKVNEVLNIKK
jgi:uncharacterized protein (UPF0332 family)